MNIRKLDNMYFIKDFSEFLMCLINIKLSPTCKDQYEKSRTGNVGFKDDYSQSFFK